LTPSSVSVARQNAMMEGQAAMCSFGVWFPGSFARPWGHQAWKQPPSRSVLGHGRSIRCLKNYRTKWPVEPWKLGFPVTGSTLKGCLKSGRSSSWLPRDTGLVGLAWVHGPPISTFGLQRLTPKQLEPKPQENKKKLPPSWTLPPQLSLAKHPEQRLSTPQPN